MRSLTTIWLINCGVLGCPLQTGFSEFWLFYLQARGTAVLWIWNSPPKAHVVEASAHLGKWWKSLRGQVGGLRLLGAYTWKRKWNPSPFLFLSFPSQEVKRFPLASAPAMMYCGVTAPKAMEPTCPGLKSVKLWAKLNISFFKVDLSQVFVSVTES